MLPVDEQGRVWLVGQHRYPLDAYSWEIPEGGCPESETPEDTALRELREETGLVAGDLELVATAHLSNSVSDEVAYIFRATELTEGPVDPEGCERIDVRRVEWDEAWSMLRRGEITDSMSVIALLHEAVRRLEEPTSRASDSPARGEGRQRAMRRISRGGAGVEGSRVERRDIDKAVLCHIIGCRFFRIPISYDRFSIRQFCIRIRSVIGSRSIPARQLASGPPTRAPARMVAGKNLPGQTVGVAARWAWVVTWSGSIR